MSVQNTGYWVACVLGGLVTTAHAQVATSEPVAATTDRWANRPVSVLLHAGYEVGGDDLATVTTNDGNMDTVTAGSGAMIEGGLLITPPIPLSVELLLGYKTDSHDFANGSASFSRGMLNAIVSIHYKDHRIGIGPTVHFATSFDCEISSVCSGNVGVDTALGLLVQWAYTHKHLDFGLRATFISYHASDVGGDVSASGTSVGAFVGARL